MDPSLGTSIGQMAIYNTFISLSQNFVATMMNSVVGMEMSVLVPDSRDEHRKVQPLVTIAVAKGVKFFIVLNEDHEY